MLVEQYGPARGIVVVDLVQIGVLARPLAPFGGGLHLEPVVGVEESEFAGLKGVHASPVISATLCEPIRREVVEERRVIASPLIYLPQIAPIVAMAGPVRHG